MLAPHTLKFLENRQGPHPLACEWVATQLAQWFGLPTFEFALITIDDEVDEIPFRRGGKAASGTAFVAKATAGHTWGGSTEELGNLANPNAVSRLIVFDTWTLNCDRYPPDLTQRRPNYDNVFLADGAAPDRRSLLVAMDHTHCFTCGGDLNEKIASISRVKDDRLYGLFPNFVPFVLQEEVEAGINRIRELERAFVTDIVKTIPGDWEVSKRARRALVDLTCRRGEYVAETVLERIKAACWPRSLFDIP